MLLGVKVYPRLADVPEPIDLAIVATPAASVPEVIGDCARPGFGGRSWSRPASRRSAPRERARTAGPRAGAGGGAIRLIGPNCLGVMRPYKGLNATFARRMALPGSVGFLSQSGALCDAILDWSLRENVGFGAFVSVGSMIDVGWGA